MTKPMVYDWVIHYPRPDCSETGPHSLRECSAYNIADEEVSQSGNICPICTVRLDEDAAHSESCWIGIREQALRDRNELLRDRISILRSEIAEITERFVLKCNTCSAHKVILQDPTFK